MRQDIDAHRRLRAYTREVTARRRWRYLAAIVLVALTGRATSALACLLPCGSAAAVAQTSMDHCATSHAPDTSEPGLAPAGSCHMVHDATDLPAVRTADRMASVAGPTTVPLPGVAVSYVFRATALRSFPQIRVAYDPPGKPLPLRV